MPIVSTFQSTNSQYATLVKRLSSVSVSAWKIKVKIVNVRYTQSYILKEKRKKKQQIFFHTSSSNKELFSTELLIQGIINALRYKE